MINNIYIALVITFLIALIWLRLNDFTARKGWISSRLSRKIIHIGTGPIFVLCWLLFPNSPYAAYLAALVPLSFTIQFFLVGIGLIKDEASIQAMTRSGDRREILKGPLYYGIVFVVITILYWTETPIGITALMIMCGGDGLADIIGRRYGQTKLPWNRQKSLEGSLSVFLGGTILTGLILLIFIGKGIFVGPAEDYLFPILIISLAATLVESLPLKDIDNITITLTALFLGRLLF